MPKKEEKAKMIDVLIPGDGPAGLSAAITLRRQGKSVSVIRRKHEKEIIRIGESLTSSAILSIKALSLLDEFKAMYINLVHGNCSSWGNDRLSYFDFIQSPMGQGWYVNRPKFDAMLLKKAQALGVDFVTVDGPGTLQRTDEDGTIDTTITTSLPRLLLTPVDGKPG